MPKKKLVLWMVLVLAVAAAVVQAVVMIRHGFSARDTPSRLEAFMARRVRIMAIPAEARNLKNPVARSPEVMRDAMQHFADHCATCHANNGSGSTEIGKNLYPKAPDMRASETQNLSDGELYYIIENGIRLSGMPAWGEPGGDGSDTWKLVHLIRHLPKLTPEEEKQMEQWNPKSQAERSEESEEEEFLRGQEKPAKHNHH